MSAPIRSTLRKVTLKAPKQITIKGSSGDENLPNQSLNSVLASQNKRKEPDTSLTESQEAFKVPARPDKRNRYDQAESSDVDSTCETEVSVSARREWLKDFSKLHDSKFPVKESKTLAPEKRVFNFKHSMSAKTPPKAPRGNMTTTQSAASTLVSRMVSSSGSTREQPRSIAPYTFKPKIQKGEIEATDDGYASVAKLSEWLANDPTSTKKKNYVRRGRNVISKSRNFEKDLENVIVIETNMVRGSVQNKKMALQGAFGSPGAKYRRASNVRDLAPRYAVSEAGASTISVAEKKDWLKKAFKSVVDDMEEVEAPRSEIIVNDASSSLSVSDKKDWLKNAFKNSKSSQVIPTPGPHSKKFGYSKAMTDVMHNRGADDDAKKRAKARFLARSARTPTKSAEAEVSKSTPSRQVEVADKNMAREGGVEERTGPPGIDESGSALVLSSQVLASFEEAESPVDFRSARMALIQRSKQNGHNVQVVNKVYLRKNKFEKIIEAESKKRSGEHELHKPSWEEASPTTGLPSTAYDKKLVPNIAQKKSFEELP